MSKVQCLRPKFIDARIVVNSLVENVERLKDIYVVAFTEDGEPEIWASGDLKTMSMASLVFQDYSTRYIRGEIEEP